jgi:hypothetical protein
MLTTYRRVQMVCCDLLVQQISVLLLLTMALGNYSDPCRLGIQTWILPMTIWSWKIKIDVLCLEEFNLFC